MTGALVAPFGRAPGPRNVVTVSTVLDDPDRPRTPPPVVVPAWPPRRCRHCHRPVPRGPLRDGLGRRCWAKAHTQRRSPARLGRPAVPRPTGLADGPDLLDLLAELSDPSGCMSSEPLARLERTALDHG